MLHLSKISSHFRSLTLLPCRPLAQQADWTAWQHPDPVLADREGVQIAGLKEENLLFVLHLFKISSHFRSINLLHCRPPKQQS